jgi:hypothetical protein
VVKTSPSTIPNSAFAVEVLLTLTSQEEESREIPGSDGNSTEEGLWKVAPSLSLPLSLALEQEEDLEEVEPPEVVLLLLLFYYYYYYYYYYYNIHTW